MSTMTQRPQPPGANECCEGGCSTCVWDRYYDEMRDWQAEQAALKAKETETEGKEQDETTK